MKIYGKKTVITDCEWELEDQPDLKKNQNQWMIMNSLTF